jgi:SAM-dependent methyltransferase
MSMGVTVDQTPRAFPLRLDDAEAISQVRRLLERAGYTEAAVCARAGCNKIQDFKSIREGRESAIDTSDALDMLIRLFMDVEIIDETTVRERLGDDATSALLTTGLLRDSVMKPGGVLATALMYPVNGVIIGSDLNVVPEATMGSLAADIVYPAITHNTGTFLATLPTSACEDFLELCAGTGVAALMSARAGGRAWAADITERATLFAQFNAQLNDLPNVTAVQGDLYEPVRGQTFDRIVAHPPYVASDEQRLIYRDGGQDGEAITRRIIADLPQYLRPGGRFHVTCAFTDRVGAPLEQRVRELLGEHSPEFDVLVTSMLSYYPSEYYCRMAVAGRITFAVAEKFHTAFRAMRVEQVVYCSMVLLRHDEPREAFTVRRRRSDAATAAEVDRLLEWETALTRAGLRERLLAARPRIAADTRVGLVRTLDGTRWKSATCTVDTLHPFAVTVNCSESSLDFLASCDGTLTVREHIARLREQGALSETEDDAAVSTFIRDCVSSGLLEVLDFT